MGEKKGSGWAREDRRHGENKNMMLNESEKERKDTGKRVVERQENDGRVG